MSLMDSVRLSPDHRMDRPRSLWLRVHLDPYLFFGLLLIAGSGLFVLFSATGGNWDVLLRQMVRLAVGFTVLLVVAQFDPNFFQRWSLGLFLVGIALLAAVPVLGSHAMGAQRWLTIPGLFRFQPAEIMKLALPIMLAWYLSRYGVPPKYRHLFVSVILLAAPVILIVDQPDLGTALLIAASGIFVIFLAGLSWKLIVALVSLAIAMTPVLWIYGMRDYQRQRVLTLFNPESDPLGAGWNTIQSITAIGSGGLQGKGYMLGTQSQLDFLPESHTDFIVAVLGEELGFVGMLLLLAAYSWVMLRGMLIAVRGRDNFCRLLAGSLTLTFFIYIFVNIGMVCGILPVVGVPLPLVSYGGTSIVTLLAGFGVLMSISTHPR